MASLRPYHHRNNSRNLNSTGASTPVNLAFGSKRNTAPSNRTSMYHRQASNSSTNSDSKNSSSSNSSNNSTMHSSNSYNSSRLENSNTTTSAESTSKRSETTAKKPEEYNNTNRSSNGKTIKSVAYPFMQVNNLNRD